MAVELVECLLGVAGAAGEQLHHQAKRRAEARAHQLAQEVAPQLDRLLERRVERLGDLRLQARLLVEADREVREQDQLGARFGSLSPNAAA